jgi:parallel beta helix pectate lyase-like protein
MPDDTALLQQEVAALNAAGRGRLDLSARQYTISDTLTLTAGLTVQGAASGTPDLVTTSPTAPIFNVQTRFPCTFRDVWLDALVPRQAGGMGIILGLPGAMNGFSRLENVTMVGQYIGVLSQNAFGWVIRDSYLVNTVTDAVQIRNQVSADTGDNLINGCVFDSRVPGSCAIRWFSGGGLRVTDCKILGHGYGLVVQQTNDGTTSDFLIDANSVENQAAIGVLFTQLPGVTQFLQNVQVSGNQFANCGQSAVAVLTPGPWLRVLQVLGNVMVLLPQSTGVNLQGGTIGLVDQNCLVGSNQGEIGLILPPTITLGPTNVIHGVTTPIIRLPQPSA